MGLKLYVGLACVVPALRKCARERAAKRLEEGAADAATMRRRKKTVKLIFFRKFLKENTEPYVVCFFCFKASAVVAHIITKDTDPFLEKGNDLRLQLRVEGYVIPLPTRTDYFLPPKKTERIHM